MEPRCWRQVSTSASSGLICSSNDGSRKRVREAGPQISSRLHRRTSLLLALIVAVGTGPALGAVAGVVLVAVNWILWRPGGCGRAQLLDEGRTVNWPTIAWLGLMFAVVRQWRRTVVSRALSAWPGGGEGRRRVRPFERSRMNRVQSSQEIDGEPAAGGEMYGVRHDQRPRRRSGGGRGSGSVGDAGAARGAVPDLGEGAAAHRCPVRSAARSDECDLLAP